MLLAVGCMAEKYADEMAESMPELDALMGVGHYEDIADLIKKQLGIQSARMEIADNVYLERDYSQLGATAYLKIAEGCDNNCSFCLIPQLRGPYKSRPMEDIIEEMCIRDSIHTPVGTIMVVSDFKMDMSPIDGEFMDFGRISAPVSYTHLDVYKRQDLHL